MPFTFDKLSQLLPNPTDPNPGVHPIAAHQPPQNTRMAVFARLARLENIILYQDPPRKRYHAPSAQVGGYYSAEQRSQPLLQLFSLFLHTTPTDADLICGPNTTPSKPGDFKIRLGRLRVPNVLLGSSQRQRRSLVDRANPANTPTQRPKIVSNVSFFT